MYFGIIWSTILIHKKWAYGDSYLETVNLSFIFTWGDGKIEDRVQVSTSPLFEGSLSNNTELRDILSKNKMHGNTNKT